MKFNSSLPFLVIIFLLTSCVDKIVTVTGHSTLQPEFAIDRGDLTSRLSAIIPAKDINITSGNTKKSGEDPFNFLTVEVVSPESFPSSGFAFSNMANEITTVVKANVKNIQDYDLVKIEVRNTVEENNTEHTRTYRKEIDI